MDNTNNHQIDEKKMDNTNNDQIDDLMLLHFPDYPPTDKLKKEKDDGLGLYVNFDKDLDLEYLNLTLDFPGRVPCTTPVKSFNELFASIYNRPDRASTSRGAPTPFNYTPKLPRDDVLAKSVPVRRRPGRNGTDVEKSVTIAPPYPWAGDRRCSVLSMTDLLSRDILGVSGEVYCKKCNQKCEIVYGLEEKFHDLCEFMTENVQDMRHRAHKKWMYPELLDCRVCNGEKCVKPVISEKKRSINWLFLLLGQMLGFCSANQLKYFCKHTMNHRTGAKDRVLFAAYMDLCLQIDPERTFYF